jgi:hypothetical protein
MGLNPTSGGTAPPLVGGITAPPPATAPTATPPRGPVLAPDGNYYDASGNQVDVNGNIIRTAQQVLQDAQAGNFAATNPTTTTGDHGGSTMGTVLDIVGKDNPLAGTINAGIDVAHGDYAKAAGDFGQGATYGTLPIPGQTGLAPGVQGVADKLADVPKAVGGAVDAAGNAIVSGVGGLLSGAPDPSVGQLDTISGTAQAQQAELDALRRQALANPTAAPQAGLVQLDQTNIDPLRQRQGTALDQLQQAANGTLPSAAEIAAKDAANRASAQAYGNAAALQGGNSSGGTLRQALDAQTQIQGDLQTKLLADRAAEQATARQQLVQGIGAAQSNEGQLATSNANLAQQTGLANQTSAINTRAQDINREQNLISGATADTSNATAAAKAALDAKVQEQANSNALKGAELSAGASIIPKVLSDERTKTDIRPADLVNLADHAPGYTFEYKSAADGPGHRVGVMAQDVAKSPLGASMVRLGDNGEMSLDGANAVGAALAMSAQALREAEAARKARGLVRL